MFKLLFSTVGVFILFPFLFTLMAVVVVPVVLLLGVLVFGLYFMGNTLYMKVSHNHVHVKGLEVSWRQRRRLEKLVVRKVLKQVSAERACSCVRKTTNSFEVVARFYRGRSVQGYYARGANPEDTIFYLGTQLTPAAQRISLCHKFSGEKCPNFQSCPEQMAFLAKLRRGIKQVESTASV